MLAAMFAPGKKDRDGCPWSTLSARPERPHISPGSKHRESSHHLQSSTTQQIFSNGQLTVQWPVPCALLKVGWTILRTKPVTKTCTKIIIIFQYEKKSSDDTHSHLQIVKHAPPVLKKNWSKILSTDRLLRNTLNSEIRKTDATDFLQDFFENAIAYFPVITRRGMCECAVIQRLIPDMSHL